jgi:hypothetical protein
MVESVPEPQTFGLPASLRVPIAARDFAAVEKHVGTPTEILSGRTRAVNAIKVRTRAIPTELTDAPLWSEPSGAAYLAVLYPDYQLWVHVDFNGYRKAWIDLGMPPLGSGIVLDHIANREATRARGMLHPFIRLCPVSGRINTNAGHELGGEGMEREYTEYLNSLSPEERAVRTAGFATEIVYADPMDLTKMLGVAPGIATLDGVRDIQHLFYG